MALCPQPRALTFLPPNLGHLSLSQGTFTRFAPKLWALYVFAPKLRAPCSQPGALLHVLPPN